MNYYLHMLDSQARQQEAARERKRQALVREVRSANRPRVKISFRLQIPKRKPRQQSTSPEFA